MSSKEIETLKKEIDQLKEENHALSSRLAEVAEIIDAIKKGKIDAVLGEAGNKEVIYIPYTADKSYRTFIEKLPEGVVALYPDGVILHANLRFTELVNQPCEKVLGNNLIDFIAPESRQMFEGFLSRAKKEDAKGEVMVLDGKGKTAPFLISLNSLQLEDHLTISVVLTDLSRIKEEEAKLISSNRKLEESILQQRLAQERTRKIARQLKEKVKQLKTVNTRLEAFAYITSHHLQEPLRKILTFGGLLKSRYYLSLEREGQNYVERMESASEKMQRMIEDVLTYSKVANDVSFEPCNLNVVLKEVLDDLEIAVKETKASIKVTTQLPTIEANPTQIHQLFLNIIQNSLKFHRVTGTPEITISSQIIMGKDIQDIPEARRDEKFCRIEIKDNGIGFSNEFSKQIFLLFKKLNPETRYSGTGIGLAISDKVVDNHRGFISAESEPDKGTSITFMLPLKQNSEEGRTENEPLRILVADDDPDDRNLIKMAFEELSLPLSLEFVFDGQEVLAALNQKVIEGQGLPDLVLLDLNMPKKDGRVALQEIKADKNLHDLNIIIFSTTKSPEDQKMAKDLGATDFFTKPSDFNEMVELFAGIYNETVKLRGE